MDTTIKFEFPPMETKQQETLTHLLQTVGEMMDVTFKTRNVVITQVEFDADRTDVATIIRRVILTAKNQAVALKKKVEA